VLSRRPQAGEGATGIIDDDAADDIDWGSKHEILNLKFERKRFNHRWTGWTRMEEAFP
jgi:hypothetical protein